MFLATAVTVSTIDPHFELNLSHLNRALVPPIVVSDDFEANDESARFLASE
jgi:hypothetical protein